MIQSDFVISWMICWHIWFSIVSKLTKSNYQLFCNKIKYKDKIHTVVLITVRESKSMYQHVSSCVYYMIIKVS